MRLETETELETSSIHTLSIKYGNATITLQDLNNRKVNYVNYHVVNI